MATSREAQGWQISVIIFALLTVILAITTYVFYSQSETSKKEMIEAQAAKKTADQEVKKMLYKVRAFQFVIGKATRDEMKFAGEGLPADAEVDEVVAKFDKDMQAFGAEVAPDEPRNYVVLPEYFLKTITAQNIKVVDYSGRERKLLDEKDAFEQKETKRYDVAAAAQVTAESDLTAERAKFVEERNRVTAEMTKIQTQLAAKDKVIKDVTEKATKERELLEKQILQLQQLSEGLKVANAKFQKASEFEVPDGMISWVNQQQRIAWINLGLADGLNRQTTFSVYNFDQAGVSTAKPKGRIEVIKVTGAHQAECRILDDQINNPIMPKDLIHSPAWSPGQEIHFALVGFMDIDKDGQSDRETIKRILALNGAYVDAELQDDGTSVGKLSINTRYLIQGDKPTEKTGAKVLAEYNNMLTEVQRYNVEIISVQEFLAMMGWKPEEKKVDYRGSKDLTGFRPRQPAPADGAKPSAPAGNNPPPLNNNPMPAQPEKPAPMNNPDPFDPFK